MREKAEILKVVLNSKIMGDINRIMKGYRPKSDNIICLILKDILYVKSIILLSSTKRKYVFFPKILIFGSVALVCFIVEDWLLFAGTKIMEI